MMILQSTWQRCAASLAPFVLATGCATTGPTPLTPEQQERIAQEQTAQLKTQLTSMQLQGLMTVLNVRDGLTSQEIADFAGDLFLTIRQANKEQKSAYNDYMSAQIQTLKKTDPTKAKQIAQIKKNVEDLEWQAEKSSRISALTTQRDAALKTGDMETARRAAIGLLLEDHAVKGEGIKCTFREPKDNPLTFKSRPFLPSTLPGLDKLDPRLITHPHICNTLKVQLLTEGLGSVAARVTSFDKWNYVNNNTAAPASSGTAISGPTAP